MISSNGSFHVGDKVVYPNHGVGVIEQIAAGQWALPSDFYLLKIKASGLKVVVPFHSVGTTVIGHIIKT